ncbi:hypothetical protein [Streptomyces marispadix]|uniref:Uncharacterized protein n=1 Tax=Streptomyces marispadix TaxID=2922868 RepID=A0ABS9SYW7_9ACTN|nr:hypothetical protein [Streptomyces marispadix]MCH6161489.1 hypothetical protein [Streptomyces marispadix]
MSKTMDFILDPPRGVSPVEIGMPYQEALQAVSQWGVPEIREPRPPRRPTGRFLLGRGTMDIVVHLERGERVDAVELWRFEGDDPDLRVLLNGVDVFRTPAAEIMQDLRSRGHQVDDSDPENPMVRGVTLGFTRDTAQEVPRTEAGLPLFFTSVLVAAEDYYE